MKKHGASKQQMKKNTNQDNLRENMEVFASEFLPPSQITRLLLSSPLS